MIKEREERVSEADQMKRDPKNLTLIITKKLIIIAMAKKIKVFVLSNKKQEQVANFQIEEVTKKKQAGVKEIVDLLAKGVKYETQKIIVMQEEEGGITMGRGI